ncbi:MAG TPA: flagellar hook capping FlgD N-terminal domain-containing protein [Candidatus Baltobacteraceae bacterium]|nr:flagellar hook capping FlgD N-terminal domain-containing protein [Candidatus Baltobacteraceae bacterium]
MAVPIIASVAGGVASSLAQSVLGSTTSSSSSVLGKDDFLRLLMTQLKNQDPMNPMQSTDFIAQTAQFTSLEQLTNMNQLLQQMATQSGATGAAGASSLIGKTVTVNGSPFQYDGLQQVPLTYSVPSGAATVSLQVLDASGKLVRTINLGPQTTGTYRVTFDGLGDDGGRLPAGSYQYQVATTSSTGTAVAGATTGGGKVSGVSVDGGILTLVIGTQHVPLTSLVGVGS